MSGITLTPVGGGDGVEVPLGKTIIGRGPFLKVFVSSLLIIITDDYYDYCCKCFKIKLIELNVVFICVVKSLC